MIVVLATSLTVTGYVANSNLITYHFYYLSSNLSINQSITKDLYRSIHHESITDICWIT